MTSKNSCDESGWENTKLLRWLLIWVVLLINAQDNLPPFPEIFFVQILRIIVWSFRTAELDVPNTDRNTEFFWGEHKWGEPHYNRQYSFEVFMHWLTFCRPIRNAVYCVRFSGLFAGLQAVFRTAFSPCPPPPPPPPPSSFSFSSSV